MPPNANLRKPSFAVSFTMFHILSESFEAPNGVRFFARPFVSSPIPPKRRKVSLKRETFQIHVLRCPTMSSDVLRCPAVLFNFRLPLIEEKEEIMRINACSQLYKKGGMEPPFQGTYTTGFPTVKQSPGLFKQCKALLSTILSFLLDNKISLSAESDLGRCPKNPQVF